MGTETKVNCYSETTAASGIVRVPKVVKGSTTSNDKQHTTSVTSSTSSSSNVPFVPLQIDENEVIEGAKQIITSIRPDWNLNFVQYKVMTTLDDGFTPEEVQGHYDDRRSLFSQKRILLQLSRFVLSSMGIKIAGTYQIRLHKVRVDFWHVIQFVNGFLDFQYADKFSDNALFLDFTIKFTDGITNKLVGCFYNPPNDYLLSSITNGINGVQICSHELFTQNSDENVAEDNNDSGNLSDADTDTEQQVSANTSTCEKKTRDVILVRVYGNKTDLLIDRKAETRNILLLHSYGFAPTLYATFKNGLVYDFVPGVTLNTENVLRPEVWSLVAQRMADMHRLVKPDWNSNSAVKAVPMLWKKTQCFFDLVPERFSDANKHKRLEGTFLPIKRMRDEFAELYNRLEALDSPVVFAHNDLLLGNVVYTESRKTVTFIDYEYADYNFQAFDIGNHFTEFAGVDTVDYARYPSRDFQLKWLRVYLQSYLQKSDVSDAEVEVLYVQVNQFALASHFFWIIWSLIQAEHSTIDFDYVGYAFLRYNEYLARKEEFLSLDERHPKCKI